MQQPSKRRKLLLSLSVVAALAAIAALAGFAAFTDQTDNTGNQIESGTVKIDQHTGATTLYNVTNQAPGNSKVACVRVAYTGSLASSVKLYTPSTVTNGTLYNLKVERGSGLTTLDNTMSCAGFTADVTNPVAYDGALGSFPTTYVGSTVTGKDAGAAWANSDAKDYRVTITQNDDSTVGAFRTVKGSGLHTIRWEARSN